MITKIIWLYNHINLIISTYVYMLFKEPLTLSEGQRSTILVSNYNWDKIKEMNSTQIFVTVGFLLKFYACYHEWVCVFMCVCTRACMCLCVCFKNQSSSISISILIIELYFFFISLTPSSPFFCFAYIFPFYSNNLSSFDLK